MNKILSLIIFVLLLPSLAIAQALPIRNDTDATLRDLGTDRNVGKNFSVDQTGRQKIVLSAGTASATNPVKLEDSASASGDAGVASLFKYLANGGVAQVGADGDYIVPTTTQFGAIYVDLNRNHVENAGASAIKTEDTSTANADAGISIFSTTNSALLASAALAGDYVPFKSDELGRLITTLAPAGESFQSCTNTMTGTGEVILKAAVASNRNYVTSIQCYNNSAVASVFSIRTGTGVVVAAGAVTALAAGGQSIMTFPVPLRSPSNTDVFVKLETGLTSTVCCAQGYISVN
jgi:hypothetical protein